MDLRRTLASWALSRPHVLVVDAPGSRALRWQIEAELHRRRWPVAISPADADLLLVVGEPGPRLAAALEVLWSQVPGPRHRQDVRSSEDLGAQLESALTSLLQSPEGVPHEDPQMLLHGHDQHAAHSQHAHNGEHQEHGEPESGGHADHADHGGPGEAEGDADQDEHATMEHDDHGEHGGHAMPADPGGHAAHGMHDAAAVTEEQHQGHDGHGDHHGHVGHDAPAADAHREHAVHEHIEHDLHDEHADHQAHEPAGPGAHDGHAADEPASHDDHAGHGGHGDHHMHHGGVVAGLAMASTAPDRDGLELDALRVSLGPMLPGWPTGLMVAGSLQGDVLTGTDVSWLDEAPGDLGQVPASAAALDSLARFLLVAGWPTAARRARAARDDLVSPEDAVRERGRRTAAALARTVRRSRTLRWSVRGIGASADGSEVLDRVLRWTDAATGGETVPDALGLEELSGLVEGQELATVRLIVASVDLASAPAHAHHGMHHA